MKFFQTIILSIFWALTFDGFAKAQDIIEANFQLTEGSKIRLFGRSNISRFIFLTSTVSGYAKFASPPVKTSDSSEIFADLSRFSHEVDIKIFVKSLKSGNGKLDHDLYRTLKAKDFENIEYRLSAFSFKNTPDSFREAVFLETSGILKLAGVEKEIHFDFKATRLDTGKFRLRGETVIRMSDFKIKPASMLAGLIRIEDVVKIQFDLIAEKVENVKKMVHAQVRQHR